MGKQARRVQKFGAFLKKKRGGRSLQSVVNRLKPIGVQIAATALFKYEDEGRVPPTDVLRGFAVVYDTPLTELVDRLLAELHVKPVDWHETVSTVNQGGKVGGTHVVSRSRRRSSAGVDTRQADAWRQVIKLAEQIARTGTQILGGQTPAARNGSTD